MELKVERWMPHTAAGVAVYKAGAMLSESCCVCFGVGLECVDSNILSLKNGF